jgi:hypothetical protein
MTDAQEQYFYFRCDPTSGEECAQRANLGGGDQILLARLVH